MMRTGLILPIAIVGTLVQLAYLAHAIPAEPKASATLASFQFDGLTLSSSLADFRKRFPNAFRHEKRCDLEVGLEVYIVKDSPAASEGAISFLDGRVFEIMAVYDVERLTRMGGLESVVDRLVSSIGSPDDHTDLPQGGMWSWNCPDAHRRAEFIVIDHSGASLEVIDTRAESTLKERRAKRIDLGL